MKLSRVVLPLNHFGHMVTVSDYNCGRGHQIVSKFRSFQVRPETDMSCQELFVINTEFRRDLCVGLIIFRSSGIWGEWKGFFKVGKRKRLIETM